MAGAKLEGRAMCKAALYKQQLVDAVFVDVHEKVVPVPGGSWGTGDKERTVGTSMVDVCHGGVIDSFRTLLVASGDLSAEAVD